MRTKPESSRKLKSYKKKKQFQQSKISDITEEDLINEYVKLREQEVKGLTDKAKPKYTTNIYSRVFRKLYYHEYRKIPSKRLNIIELGKKYREENKDKLYKNHANYRIKNKEKIKRAMKIYYQQNKKERQKYSRERYHKLKK